MITTHSPWGRSTSETSWTCGRWSLEVRGDELADLRCDGALVLRGVRAVARDRDWQTARPTVMNRRRTKDSLRLELDIRDRGLDLSGNVIVSVDEDLLGVEMEMTARSDSWTNRTGLVALHPPHLAGSALTVGHIDGTITPMTFPARISPHQPARDIASLSWSENGIPLHLDLEGDVFEMEDQRNWTDASYKTYSRSLDEPFPYRLATGERIRQRLTLRAGKPRTPTRPERSEEGPLRIRLVAGGRFPTIAVGASTAPDPAPEVGDPVASHQHVELDLTDPAWPAALERARREAEDLTVLLVVQSGVSATDLEPVARALHGARLRWVCIVDAETHTSSSAAVAALRDIMPPRSPIVGGSRSHFTEVNRAWGSIPWADIDGLVVPTTPLFHVLETEQLVEAVGMQRIIAEDVTSRAPGTPVHIGPVTLRPRFNNVAISSPPLRTRADLAEGYGAHHTGVVDPRQASEELAPWAAASAAAFAVPGIASLTYFESWGPRGIRTAGGDDVPVRGALEALTGMQGGELLTSESPDGRVWALGGRAGERVEALLANLWEEPRRVVVECKGRDLAQLTLGPMSWRHLHL